MTFEQLHQQNEPLLIANIWDAASTKVAEKLGFQAIGTSSAAIAAMLGYQDGENISFAELAYLIKRITENTSLPLTVDIEAGYSRTATQTAAHIKQLVSLGVVGVNIEDSLVSNERKLVDADEFASYISAIKQILKAEHIDIFLNIRTDTFLLLLDDPLAETENRISLYSKAGANGIFVPGIEKRQDIKSIVEHTHLPINVMAMPYLPSFKQLNELGVKRVSMGNFLFEHMFEHFKQTLNTVKNKQSFEVIF